MYYIHKHEVALQYGGAEEGGWYYGTGSPVPEWSTTQPHHCFNDEDTAYLVSRFLNEREFIRRSKQEKYPIHSVLADESTHYAYAVEDFPEPYDYPLYRPHYE